MKALLKLLFIFQILILTVNSYAGTPMSGVYTIGPTGDFPSIAVATGSVSAQGVSGPVILKIQSGTYHETTPILPIPNANLNQTVTLESMAGNPDSVILKGSGASHIVFNIIGASFWIFRNLTLQDITLTDACSEIIITGNKFISDPIDKGIEMNTGIISNFSITNNINLLSISNILGFRIESINISGNSFMDTVSSLLLDASHDIEIHNNTGIGKIAIEECFNVNYTGNKLSAINPTLYPFRILDCFQVVMTNNFINNEPGFSTALFNNNNTVKCINNTFHTHGYDTTIVCINNGSIQLRNNIYDNDSGGYSISYTANTVLNSDYNTYYNGGDSDIISYNGTAYTLSAFQSATGQDLHSVLKKVTFVSSTDLHLHPINGGDEELIGAPDTLVTVDIDGEPRNALYPYKGADELDNILPVELSSFTASVSGSNVMLTWTTSSENNNSGFAIERSVFNYQLSMFNDQWDNIGFVYGNGTTSSPKNYEFTDRNLSSGKYKYRLRQNDYNGNFVYYNLSNEVEIGVPAEFRLAQNYPNPFNPETNIIFDIPSEQFVKLNIYDISGRLITQLVNEVRTAGRYSVKFNAANMSSGIYFYEITTGDFSDRKKMIILK